MENKIDLALVVSAFLTILGSCRVHYGIYDKNSYIGIQTRQVAGAFSDYSFSESRKISSSLLDILGKKKMIENNKIIVF